MTGEPPLWAVFLFVLGQFGPLAVPALLVASMLLIGRYWHESKVRHAAARRALRAHSAQALNVEDPP